MTTTWIRTPTFIFTPIPDEINFHILIDCNKLSFSFLCPGNLEHCIYLNQGKLNIAFFLNISFYIKKECHRFKVRPS